MSAWCAALRMLTTPCGVNRWPLRALRVGITQSNMSMPRAHRLRRGLRRADAHQVARSIGRHAAASSASSTRSRAPRRLADREAADRVAVEADARSAPRATRGAELQVACRPARCRTARSRLPRRVELGAAALRPAQRQLHRVARLRLGGRVRRALVEHHHDVGVERALDLASSSPGVRNTASPSTGERNCTPSSVILRSSREAEHLEAARVGEDRPLPVHEADAGRRARAITSGPGRSNRWKVLPRMICAPRPVELLRRHRLDRAVGADRHEGRRLDRAVRETRAGRGAPRRRCASSSNFMRASPRHERGAVRLDEHRVAIAEEAVAPRDRVPVRGAARARGRRRRTPASAASTPAGGSW